MSDGTLDNLRAKVSRERRLTIDLENADETVTDPDAEIIEQEGQRVTLRFDPLQVSPAALIARLTSQHAIRDLFVQNPPIEQIIARLYHAE